jgi:ABC-2 type transport system permease protein
MAYATMSFDYSPAQRTLEYSPEITYSDYAVALEQTDKNETMVTLTYYNDEGDFCTSNIPKSVFEAVLLPTAMENKFGYMSIASFLIMILAASIIGTEYKWGTIRQTLARGIPRIQYLGSKFLTLIIIALGFILVATIFAFIANIVTTCLITGGISWDFLTAGFIGSILLSICLILFILLVWICFTALFTTLFKSSTVGIIISFLFYVIEGLVIMSKMSTSYTISNGVTTTLTNPPEWMAYTIGYNIQYLWAYISPDSANEYLLQQTLTTAGQSVLVLSIFCLLFILASFYIFRRQDLMAD